LSHDIYLSNKDGEVISHVRFTMGDMNAIWFYDLFDAQKYNAGVSGSGKNKTFSLPQMEKAYKNYLNDKGIYQTGNQEFFTWQQNEILKFIKNGIETAKKEDSVTIAFC